MCDFDCTYCVWNGQKLCCSASDMKEVGENVVEEYNLLSGGIGKHYSENWYYGYGVKPEWCPIVSNEAKEVNILTKDFLNAALKKHMDNEFEFNYKTYWGMEATNLTSKNSQIKVTCKNHNISFETYPQEFLNGSKLCPICRMERYGFSAHDKKLYIAHPRSQQDKDICVSPLCKDKALVNKIVVFLNSNITPNIYYTYFINDDYTIDIEPGYEYAWQGLNNPNKGVSVSVEDKSIPEYIKFGEAIVSRFTITSKMWDSFTEKWIQGERVNTFEGCPRRVFGDFICKDENLSSFIGMPSFIGGVFDLSNNVFDDNAWEYAKEHIESEFGDYKISNNKFVKYRKELY